MSTRAGQVTTRCCANLPAVVPIRASNLALLRKPTTSIDVGNVIFARIIRMKPSEEQGLSLFPGTEFETCPMLAMALAMLPPHQRISSTTYPICNTKLQSLSPDVPLLDILDHPVDTTGLGAPSAAGAEKTPTVYSHVNCVLDRIPAVAGVTAALTSRSFRRGGGHNTSMRRPHGAVDVRQWRLEHEHNEQWLQLYLQHQQRRSDGQQDTQLTRYQHKRGNPGLAFVRLAYKEHDFQLPAPPVQHMPQIYKLHSTTLAKLSLMCSPRAPLPTAEAPER
ncbi:LOW QUALITY PROTEIN: RxLR effector candidate protein [Phytophthora palmivora]|uniref:RxLR effector candidate protein n=1 Tax=Phytophthora palmivora TaxID=4796 RepID=A0A2P4YFX6_9STRA|nr:LOW QUALITY PROTEIN: RxLR effector candidate protein [Phytophthora palmivora]